MRVNASTPFNEQGFSDLCNDVRTLYLAVGGGANDMNFNSVASDQENADAGSTACQRAQNLKDLTNVTEAVANLGLTSVVASVSTGSSGGGSFLRIANNLSDVASLATTLGNLGLDKINFHAYGSATQNTAGAGEVAQFNTEISDVGGYYDTGTYKYTPMAGKYIVGFNLMFQQSISSFGTDVNFAFLDHENATDYGRAVVSSTKLNTDYSLNQTALMQFSGSQFVRVKISLSAGFYNFNTVTLQEFYAIRISA